jgi:hypothetical protein
MERNATYRFRNYQTSVYLAIVYVAVIATVLYPALHEELDVRVLLWNSIPPTLGLLAIATALGKPKPRLVASVIFALFTGGVATFFSVAWFFTPLDLDSHSGSTKLVFVFAPMFSLSLATIAAGNAWFVARMSKRAATISEKEKDWPRTS